MKVLVIEENQRVVKDISFCLKVRYPEVIVVSVAEGTKGIEMVETESPDLVMADASLPDIDNLELVSKIREFSDVPLIILSEAETDMDRAKGLEAGVDEYVTKPFSPIELLARVRAVLRRAQGLGFKPERSVSIGELSINFTTHEVFLSGKQVKLTPLEYHLLSELVRNEGRVLTHSALLEKLWGSEYDAGDFRFIKKYIHSLRQKLHDDADNPRMIHTERGVGYKFITPT